MKDIEKEYLVFHRESCNVDSSVSSFKMTGKSKADIRKKFNIINHVITDIKLIKAVDDNKEGAADLLIDDVESEVIVEDFNPLGAKADIEVGMVQLDNGLIISENKYKEYCKSLKKIQTCYREAGNLYLEIGCELYKVNYCGLYTVELADNIYEYAANNFGISRGTTNEYLNVVKNFCKYEVGGWESKGHPVPELKEKYKDYSVSQLVILMRASDELKEKLVPTLSTRKMKELIKKDKQSKDEQSKDEQSKGEQSRGEQSKDEQSKGEQSRGEQSKEKEHKNQDIKMLENGRYVILVKTESNFKQGLPYDEYQTEIDGSLYQVKSMRFLNGCWYDENYNEFDLGNDKEVISCWAMPTVEDLLKRRELFIDLQIT